MAHVVTDNCQQCRFTECVATCPVACFHGDDTMLYIDPDDCIDCGACVPACPVQAIQEALDLPQEQHHWIACNAERAQSLPAVRQTGTPLPTAEARRRELGF